MFLDLFQKSTQINKECVTHSWLKLIISFLPFYLSVQHAYYYHSLMIWQGVENTSCFTPFSSAGAISI